MKLMQKNQITKGLSSPDHWPVYSDVVFDMVDHPHDHRVVFPCVERGPRELPVHYDDRLAPA